MSRYAFGQCALAFVITAVGVVKAVRLFVDWVEDGISDMAGLR